MLSVDFCSGARRFRGNAQHPDSELPWEPQSLVGARPSFPIFAWFPRSDLRRAQVFLAGRSTQGWLASRPRSKHFALLQLSILSIQLENLGSLGSESLRHRNIEPRPLL